MKKNEYARICAINIAWNIREDWSRDVHYRVSLIEEFAPELKDLCHEFLELFEDGDTDGRFWRVLCDDTSEFLENAEKFPELFKKTIEALIIPYEEEIKKFNEMFPEDKI